MKRSCLVWVCVCCVSLVVYACGDGGTQTQETKAEVSGAEISVQQETPLEKPTEKNETSKADASAPLDEAPDVSPPSEQKETQTEALTEPVVETTQTEPVAEVANTEPTPETGGAETIPEKTPFTIRKVKTCQALGRPDKTKYTLHQDLQYAAIDPKQPQKLDVIVPKSGTGPFPLVIMVHGGGWAKGDKASFVNKLGALAVLGYAGATINYRLLNQDVGGVKYKNTFPAAIHDVRCAVRWLLTPANAKKYNIDTTRVVIMGYSAGGHLASLVGVKVARDALLDSPDCPTKATPIHISGIVSFSGVYDLTTFSGNVVPTLLGDTPTANPQKAKRSSPLYHIDGTEPPILMYHGTDDKTVEIAQADQYERRLKTRGANYLYIRVKGGEHKGPFTPVAIYDTANCSTLALLEDLFGKP